MNIHIGQKIYWVRTHAGFSQTELEAISGISRKTLSRYENTIGKLNISYENLQKIADCCKVSIRVFEGELDEASFLKLLSEENAKDSLKGPTSTYSYNREAHKQAVVDNMEYIDSEGLKMLSTVSDYLRDHNASCFQVEKKKS